MLLWLLLVLATDRVFAAADPIDVAKLTVRQDEWMTLDESKWWAEEGRYWRIDPWIVDMGYCAPWRMQHWLGVRTEHLVGWAFWDLKIRLRKREQCELRKALEAIEWPLWKGGE